MQNDLIFCRCDSCGTYSFYALTESVEACKSCGEPVDIHSNLDKND
jgi:uncharacterized protein (DUF983 family)